MEYSKIIKDYEVLDLKEDDLDFMKSKKVWIDNERYSDSRWVEDWVYGKMEFVG